MDLNRPEQRNQRDNDVISGSVRNWVPGAERLFKDIDGIF